MGIVDDANGRRFFFDELLHLFGERTGIADGQKDNVWEGERRAARSGTERTKRVSFFVERDGAGIAELVRPGGGHRHARSIVPGDERSVGLAEEITAVDIVSPIDDRSVQ